MEVEKGPVVRLIARHPSYSADSISQMLNMSPSNASSVGEHRMTPKGSQLKGVYKETVWSRSLSIEGGDVSNSIEELISTLQKRKLDISKIISTGGNILITIDLPGNLNIGEELSVSQLFYLSSLQISFGFEVFPQM